LAISHQELKLNSSSHLMHSISFDNLLHFSAFHVEDESDLYRLHIGGYSGTAGDSLTVGENL